MKKKKREKKAFTLIELLAVIVILAIIALIVTVSVNKLIDNARKETYKESVRGIIRAGENYVGRYALENRKEPDYPFNFVCDGEKCSFGNDKLEFTGEVPKSGTIVLVDHKTVEARYLSNGRYCVSGTKFNLQIAKNCSDIDTTSPIISGTLEGKVIHLSIVEEESGVKGYCVTTNEEVNSCNWIDSNNKSIDYELESAGTYYVYVKDNKDNISNKLEFVADISAFNYAATESSYEANATTTTYTGTAQTSSYAASSYSYDCQYHASGNNGVCDSDCISGTCFLYNGTVPGYPNGWECNKATKCTGHSCPQGGTLSDTTCIVVTGYTCDAGDTLSGSTCTHVTGYTCNDGDILDNQTCKHYECPDGGNLNGTICER